MGRILVADDHDALRRGLVRGLTEAGHEVEEAANGNAAIERLHDSYFDIVLSDLKMAAATAWTCCARRARCTRRRPSF